MKRKWTKSRGQLDQDHPNWPFKLLLKVVVFLFIGLHHVL